MKKKHPKQYAPIDLKQIKRIPIRTRKNLVQKEQFARLPQAGASFKEFLDSIPPILAGLEFSKLIHWITDAISQDHPVGLGMGAHVIKCGLSPIIQEWMEQGILSIVAFHGACAIHDLEFAMIGESSEDVKRELDQAQFGMAEETGILFGEALRLAQKEKIGLGLALGKIALQQPFAHLSIMATAAKIGFPLTVHVALGTDIVHMHPETDGAILGEASLMDFRSVCQALMDFESGVWINLGSAVILPEVFLKAVAVARNLGRRFEGLKTANLDMLRHYRSTQNVITRPTSQGLHITGHHEILVPMLRLALLEVLKAKEQEASEL